MLSFLMMSWSASVSQFLLPISIVLNYLAM
jgi:hypothetical protein